MTDGFGRAESGQTGVEGGGTDKDISKASKASIDKALARVSRVRMAERSKALRSGRSLVLQAWVRIPLLTNVFGQAMAPCKEK